MFGCRPSGLEVQSFTTTLPACRYFSLPAVVSGVKLKAACSVPVVVNLVYSANNVNASKIAGSKQRLAVDAAGIYSHSGGAGAVPVMHFGEVASLVGTVGDTLGVGCSRPGGGRRLDLPLSP